MLHKMHLPFPRLQANKQRNFSYNHQVGKRIDSATTDGKLSPYCDTKNGRKVAEAVSNIGNLFHHIRIWKCKPSTPEDRIMRDNCITSIDWYSICAQTKLVVSELGESKTLVRILRLFILLQSHTRGVRIKEIFPELSKSWRLPRCRSTIYTICAPGSHELRYVQNVHDGVSIIE